MLLKTCLVVVGKHVHKWPQHVHESATVKKIEIIAFFSLTNGECKFQQNVLLYEQKMKFERKTTRVFAFNTQENPLLDFQFDTSKIKIFEKLH